MVNGISYRTVFFLTTIGDTTAEIPKISHIFIMLLPITLPTATPPASSIEAVMLTAASGADVPKATMVSPIMI